MAPKRTTRANPADTTATTSITNAQLKAMIDQGVTDALAAHDANKNTNGDDSHNSGTGIRRQAPPACACIEILYQLVANLTIQYKTSHSTQPLIPPRPQKPHTTSSHPIHHPPPLVRGLQGNDLLIGNRGSDLYIIFLQETNSLNPICFIAKASPTQAWLWHQRLSHLNFDYINLLLKKDVVIGLPKLKYVKDQLCSSCEVSKAKRSSFKIKVVLSSKGRLNLLYIDLCGPMRVASINGKKYILVIVDDYSRYTWTLFLRSKDETPEVLKDFLKMIQQNLQAQVISVRTNRGTEFLNKTLNAYFKEEGIKHQNSTPRTPE
ncbi:retrovirus-related pol polyprotein from transposon TNT 1-94 [Tanacetum coccineum]